MRRLLYYGRLFLSCFLYLAIANMIGGCTYYRVRGTIGPDAGQIAAKALVPEKYVIVHDGDGAWHLDGIALNEAKSDIVGDLEALSLMHLSYLKDYEAKMGRHERGPIQYQPRKSTPTQEIHIYLDDGTLTDTIGHATIPVSGVRKIEIYDPAIGATVASHLLGGLAIAAGVVVIIGVIALATKSSCPFLYTRDVSGRWAFSGELYGGAIAEPLERDDYMPLPGLRAIDGSYELKIANELKERQYTNIAELLVVDHPVGVAVLADKDGKLHSISHASLPGIAQGGSNDCLKKLEVRDASTYGFDVPDVADPAFSSLTMSFPKPASAKRGKLVIHAKNSYWLDYMFARFTEQFGTRYNEFAAEQKKAPAAESMQWSMEQGIPLSVLVQTDKGWEQAGHFDVVGPLASRDMVMQLDLSRVNTTDLKLKLRCGARFWELDYAAMDFSEDVPMSVVRLSPYAAIDENGKETGDMLSSKDEKYLVQPEPGNEVIARYKVPVQAPATARTVLFHSRGYYEYIRNYTNKPNLVRLMSFKKAGAFTRFAASEYSKIYTQKDFLASALNN
jgi:hypothetical protein